MLIVLLLMVLGISHMLITSRTSGGNPEVERQRKTFEALAQAKQALIAWSVVQSDVHPSTQKTKKKTEDENGKEVEVEVDEFTYRRPGALPCPDGNFFGSATSGNASGSCSASGGTSLGRLPWKSIDAGNLRDAHGEVLWYAVSDNFRSRVDHNKAAINSDTKGTLKLFAADGSTPITLDGEELAAVIIAPGPPLPGQNRISELPGTTGNKIASEYLEAFNGKNNANAAGPFIMGPIKDSSGNLISNDLIIGITARELIAAAEKRALNEAQKALENYFYTNGRYPNPAHYNGPNCASPVNDVKSITPLCTKTDDTHPDPPCAIKDTPPFISLCASSSTVCSGRLPEDVLSPEALSPDIPFPYVAPWFIQNGWGRVMIYAIEDAGAGCPTSLNVGKIPKRYVLFTPGAARTKQNRPSKTLSNYLEDEANTDGWSGNFDFVVPGGESNDQLRTSP
ncbi:MAG: hypothetical protein LBI59_02940 [Candidatus Accumulibacter sp.]|nr:hypothetical protein [Accumulibacter sp.]